MKPIPEKHEEWDVLYSSGKDEYKPFILKKIQKKFTEYDFELSESGYAIMVGSGLSNEGWHTLFGYCLALEEVIGQILWT